MRAGDTLPTMLRLPSAFIPVAMSLAALAVVVGQVIAFGVAREADEGAAAHLWQLLMGGQVPFVAYFAVKWLRPAPKFGLLVLAIQVVAALVAVAPVYFLKL